MPISWDEALDTIADKIMELRDNNETHKYMLMRGRYSYMRDILYDRMTKIIGSPNNISHSAICAEAEKFGPYYTEGYWGYRQYDVEKPITFCCGGRIPWPPTARSPITSRPGARPWTAPRWPLWNPGCPPQQPRRTNGCPSNRGMTAPCLGHCPRHPHRRALAPRLCGDFTDGKNRFRPGRGGRGPLSKRNTPTAWSNGGTWNSRTRRRNGLQIAA